MKRTARLPILVITAASTVAIVVLLSGCSGTTGGETTTSGATSTSLSTTTSTEAVTTTVTAAKLAWGATGTWQGVAITVGSPQVDPLPESVDTGDKVVYCEVKVINNSKDPLDYNGLDFTLYDTAHSEYDNTGLTSMPDFGEGTLNPGESVEGAVAFELPQGATPGGLEWQPETADTPLLIWGQP